MSAMMSSYHKVSWGAVASVLNSCTKGANDLLTGTNDSYVSEDEDGLRPPACLSL